MKTLRYGATGLQVKILQLALKRWGEESITIDGIWGQQTQGAVLRFQKTEGITQDGIVGDETCEKLSAYLAGYKVIRIASGDSFYRLAEKYHSSVQAIQTANPEINPLNLQIGQELVIPFLYPLVTDEVAFCSPLTEAAERGLEARYPFIERSSYGKSAMGKTLYALRIGTGKRVIGFGGGIHANEWITTPLLLKFLEDYAIALVNDRDIGDIRARTLYNSVSLYLTPFQNPDGIDLVTGYLYDGTSYELARRIAMSYPVIPFPNGWKANIRGIDLNLQFPAGWEKARAIKFSKGFRSPAPRDYVGSKPLEAPEAKALAEYTETIPFDRLLTYHTQGEVIYWQYESCEPKDAYKIGKALKESTGYTLSDTPKESSYAGYKDWFIDRFCRPGYTLEVGLGQNPLPISALLPIYQKNLPGFIAGMLAPCGTVT